MIVGEQFGLSADIEITDEGVRQRINVMGEITERFANLAAAQMDVAIRQKLIELGWTPPA